VPRWDTLAGRVLDAFFAGVQEAMPDYHQPITIFGSAAVQLCLDEDCTSADVDLMVLTESARLRQIAKSLGLGCSGTVRPTYGVQICPPQLFLPTPHYLQRAYTEVRHGLRVVLPHLQDILIAKLHRARTEDQEGLVAKDRRAFQRVRELCSGHPTAEDLLADLIQCEPYFRLPHDGGLNSFRLNVEDLFSSLYEHRLDVEGEILVPARTAEQSLLRHPKGTVTEMLASLQPMRD